MIKKNRSVCLTAIVVFMLAACGGQSTQDPTIATAVALTVDAQNTANANTPTSAPSAPPAITQTPLQFAPTLTQVAPPPSPTLQGYAAKAACAKASLVDETIPDGTIFTPGEQFTKTWQIQNVSSCVWDTNYKIIFWNGDVLGGGYVYNFPQVTPPGGTMPVSLVLTAPMSNDTYKSEWMLQTTDGIDFGVGQYSAPFYAQIVVSDAKHPGYTITKVEYNVTRDPPTGCPANVTYTVTATVTTNGPFKFSYFWTQKDGNDSGPKPTEITSATSQIYIREWKLGLAATPGEKWIEFNVSDPFQQAYGKAYFLKDCGQP